MPLNNKPINNNHYSNSIFYSGTATNQGVSGTAGGNAGVDLGSTDWNLLQVLTEDKMKDFIKNINDKIAKSK